MKNHRLTYLIIMAVTVFVSSCGTTQTDTTSEDNANLVTAYLEVKDALVKTDATLAGEAAAKMAGQLGDSQDENMAKIKTAIEAIANAEDVAVQREHFNSLSQTMYSYLKQNGGENQGLYKQYCPMAFNDTGAFWLASEKEINNPYFGSMMLRCGVVQETL
jgi:hypothetical protein